MKISNFKLMLCILLLPVALKAQQSGTMDNKKHKIVIQFNDADSLSQNRVGLQVQNIRNVWPTADVEVVCLGAGLDALMTANSKIAPVVEEWSAKGVVFAACANTMRLRKVMKEDLLKQAVVVPSAVIELAMKQEEGWSYFKGGK
jgi:intracellular sulfur oxidation DsrE/DsrF family protein